MKRYKGALIEAYQQSPNVLCILSAIAIFSIDILTGEHIHFPIFFAVPVGLAAWQLNRSLAYALAVALPLLRVVLFYLLNNSPFNGIALVNALIIIIALAIYAYLATKMIIERKHLEHKISLLQARLDSCDQTENNR